MPLSLFYLSALLLCIPYASAAYQDLKHRTVSLQTWKWCLIAVPTSVLGWWVWYSTGTMDTRVFLLLAGFILVFFIAGYLWKTGQPSIGGGDVLAIGIMLVFVPVLPELGNIIYIIPLCICTMITSLYWNCRGKETPFIFPFMVCHAGLVSVAGLLP